METQTLAARLADEVRGLYEKDPEHGARNIEALINSRLSDQSPEVRSTVVREMIKHFKPPASETECTDIAVITRMFGLFLGRTVEPEDLTSTELLNRMAESLNTIFDSLNQLVNVINRSFSSNEENGEQTIRQFIGFHLEGDDQTKPLEEYLGQINKAFLTSHEAFKKAAHTKLAQVLKSLGPKEIAKERGSGLKIGPLRKAEDYDILQDKIARIQKWFDSGRFMEDFLREFENNCQAFHK